MPGSVRERPMAIAVQLPAVLLSFCIAAFLAYVIFVLRFVRGGHDQTWYLYMAQRLLEGVPLYGPQLTETNPPLIMWFSVLPVLLAKVFQVSPNLMLKIIVVMMVIASAAWTARILRAAVIKATLSKMARAAVFLLVSSVLLVEISIPRRDFGQREHLLVICALPYILAAITGAVRRLPFAEQVALGLAAGMGACFKPQQALVFVGLEVFLAIRSRSFRRAVSPEFAALVLTCCAYVLSVRLMTPLYFRETLPLLRETYWAFAMGSFGSLFFQQLPYYLLSLVTLVAVVVARRRLRFPGIPIGLVICSYAASLAYALQTGFGYQKIPLRAFLGLAVLSFAADLLSPYLARLIPDLRFSRGFAAATVLLAVVLSIALSSYERNLAAEHDQVERRYVEQVLARYPPQITVYVFTTSPSPSFPAVVERNMVWGSRFAHLWMLPAILQNQLGPAAGTPFKALSRDTVASLSVKQQRDTAEDFRRWKPSLVLIERCTPQDECLALGSHNVDLLAWFLQSPDFAAEWSHYHRQASEQHYGVFTRAD